MDNRWIARSEAITRLGVKPQTLYAYVSRGRIAARPDPSDPRRSLYAAADVARMAGQERQTIQGPAIPVPPQGAAARGEADVISSVSLIANGRLFYRGLDAVQMADHATLETAARRLWDCNTSDPFPGLKPRIDPITGNLVQRRIMAVLGRRMIEDTPVRLQSAEALRIEAAAIFNEVVDSIAGPGPRLYLHQRLGRGFKVPERDAHLIRRACILAADAGLDEAVMATRAASSGGATLAGSVLAGLSVLAGPAAAGLEACQSFVIEARRDPDAAAHRHFEAQGQLPGFGGGPFCQTSSRTDPRASALLDAAELPDDLSKVRQAGEVVSGCPVDFRMALTLTARRLDLPPTGAIDLMLIGRLMGLLAHALDQAIDGSPIRARLRYVGQEPGAN